MPRMSLNRTCLNVLIWLPTRLLLASSVHQGVVVWHANVYSLQAQPLCLFWNGVCARRPHRPLPCRKEKKARANRGILYLVCVWTHGQTS